MLLILHFYFLIPGFRKSFCFLSLFSYFLVKERGSLMRISLLLTKFATYIKHLHGEISLGWDIYVCTLCIFTRLWMGNENSYVCSSPKDEFIFSEVSSFMKNLLKVPIWESIPDISARVSQMFLNSYALGTPQQITYFFFTKDMFNVLPACNYNLYYLD